MARIPKAVKVEVQKNFVRETVRRKVRFVKGTFRTQVVGAHRLVWGELKAPRKRELERDLQAILHPLSEKRKICRRFRRGKGKGRSRIG